MTVKHNRQPVNHFRGTIRSQEFALTSPKTAVTSLVLFDPFSYYLALTDDGQRLIFNGLYMTNLKSASVSAVGAQSL